MKPRNKAIFRKDESILVVGRSSKKHLQKGAFGKIKSKKGAPYRKLKGKNQKGGLE